MDNPLRGVPRNLDARIRKVISAHEAVRIGIATHVEKEHAKRQDEHHRKEQDANLSRPLTPSRHGP